VQYHDPYVTHVKHDGWELTSVPDEMEAVRQADCVAIITNHKVYNYDAILEAARLVVDTRNALGTKGRNHPKVVRL